MHERKEKKDDRGAYLVFGFGSIRAPYPDETYKTQNKTQVSTLHISFSSLTCIRPIFLPYSPKLYGLGLSLTAVSYGKPYLRNILTANPQRRTNLGKKRKPSFSEDIF